jgi:hypothetical protein
VIHLEKLGANSRDATVTCTKEKFQLSILSPQVRNQSPLGLSSEKCFWKFKRTKESVFLARRGSHKSVILNAPVLLCVHNGERNAALYIALGAIENRTLFISAACVCEYVEHKHRYGCESQRADG